MLNVKFTCNIYNLLTKIKYIKLYIIIIITPKKFHQKNSIVVNTKLTTFLQDYFHANICRKPEKFPKTVKP